MKELELKIKGSVNKMLKSLVFELSENRTILVILTALVVVRFL
jgi:hypothetical protein